MPNPRYNVKCEYITLYLLWSLKQFSMLKVKCDKTQKLRQNVCVVVMMILSLNTCIEILCLKELWSVYSASLSPYLPGTTMILPAACKRKNKTIYWLINTLMPRQNGQHFPDNIFQYIFLNENVWISIEISLNYVHKSPINNKPALVQIMAWRRPGDKPLSEPMMVRLLTHICVTRPQWVK